MPSRPLAFVPVCRALCQAGADPPRPTTASPLSVLGRLSAFVPQLAAANAELASALSTRPASDFDVESVEEGGRHIEMDLACGVLDLRDEAAQQAAQLAMESQALAEHILPTGDTSSDDDESEDESEDEDDTEDGGGQQPREQRRRRIEEL